MPQSVRSILCVHPNAELYGSDRVFLQAVRAFGDRWPGAAITVVLPCEGRLADEARGLGATVCLERMTVLRRADLIGTLAGVMRLFHAVPRARARMRGQDLVYISTVVAIDYLLATRFTFGAVLVHVHELPAGWTRRLVGGMLRLARGRLIFVSAAVRDVFRPLAERRGAVIWNATRDVAAIVHEPSERLNVLLIGRFNAWKGQRVLIEAVARMAAAHRGRLFVRLVGSAFAGQDRFERAAADLIVARGLSDCIAIHGFQPDPSAMFAWAAVVVVPSTRPEPFGLVAIEAMAAARAVVAADHGGLAEIVVDGETGMLVTPGDAESLAKALAIYLNQPSLAVRQGQAGRGRFEALFREPRFVAQIADLAAAEIEQDHRPQSLTTTSGGSSGAPRILCVHQGAELYGSDRSFLQAVIAFRARWPTATIDVMLAADGPLRPLLAKHADTVVVRDLLVLRRATPIRTVLKTTIGLPWYVVRAARNCASADLTYVNTVVVADHMLAARLTGANVVVHAREIPRSLALTLVRCLVRFAGTTMIYNSRATARALSSRGGGRVVHNGFDPVPGACPPQAQSAFTADRPLRIAMLGRINDWKGQDVLVDAIASLPHEDRVRVQVRIVGGTYGEATAPLVALCRRIEAAALSESVLVEPFTGDPGEVYRWADLCAVPSRHPEPFGRVAIEAMAHGRAVLAAAHGGLVEIVEHDRSGWLVPPGDARALADAIAEAVADPALVAKRGAAALDRFAARFTTAAMAEKLLQAVGAGLSSTPPHEVTG